MVSDDKVQQVENPKLEAAVERQTEVLSEMLKVLSNPAPDRLTLFERQELKARERLIAESQLKLGLRRRRPSA